MLLPPETLSHTWATDKNKGAGISISASQFLYYDFQY